MSGEAARAIYRNSVIKIQSELIPYPLNTLEAQCKVS